MISTEDLLNEVCSFEQKYKQELKVNRCIEDVLAKIKSEINGHSMNVSEVLKLAVKVILLIHILYKKMIEQDKQEIIVSMEWLYDNVFQTDTINQEKMLILHDLLAGLISFFLSLEIVTEDDGCIIRKKMIMLLDLNETYIRIL